MRLELKDIGILVVYCAFMTIGQLGFKYVSLSLGKSMSLTDVAINLPFNILFWVTGGVYFISTIYWTWLLTKIPLTIAYPFVSLTLVIVPCLSWVLFSETLTLVNLIGIAVIIVGIGLVVH